MQIYFGVVSEQDAKFFDVLFTAENALGDPTQFFYGLEYGSNSEGFNGIKIYDTVGRSIPIDIDSVPELILALQELLEWQKEVDASYNFLEKVKSGNFKISATALEPS